MSYEEYVNFFDDLVSQPEEDCCFTFTVTIEGLYQEIVLTTDMVFDDYDATSYVESIKLSNTNFIF